MSATAVGGTITLTDKNSVVTIDPNTQAGVNGWTVDGVNQLTQQAYWYRIGSSGPDSSLDSLGLTDSGTYHGTRGAYAVYGDPNGNGLSVEVDYLLAGSAPLSQQSALNETISISNNSGTAQTLHFFQYSNFDLNGGVGQDSVQFPNANTVAQTNSPALTQATTVVNPAPLNHEGNFYPNTLNSLNDLGPTTLSNAPSIGGSSLGPGNMTSAYEWEQTIPAGGTFVITSGSRLSVATAVPEPSTIVLLLGAGLALIGKAWHRRRA